MKLEFLEFKPDLLCGVARQVGTLLIVGGVLEAMFGTGSNSASADALSLAAAENQLASGLYLAAVGCLIAWVGSLQFGRTRVTSARRSSQSKVTVKTPKKRTPDDNREE